MLSLALALLAAPNAPSAAVTGFILAGHSNMEGAGQIKADPVRNGGKGSLEFLVKDAGTEHHDAGPDETHKVSRYTAHAAVFIQWQDRLRLLPE